VYLLASKTPFLSCNVYKSTNESTGECINTIAGNN
jgi:hypothetical protein